ncbi:hypothetical protein EV702DRAFT_452445 [Suillus placidus]|uniref:F-box domain-containing protein n=1 Tax=Suillus placidus TaxID=48579 RepID=A0A9P7D1N5_9AGAM|nr:hypothetical protein EV702DRAFT_452445 [Suillus placidus]
MQPKTSFLSLARELLCYILSFLPYQNILRCTSVCKVLHQIYRSSSGLQYIIELSGQRLLPVPNTDIHTPTSIRLQTLRDRAHAWFKFDLHSFKTIALPKILYAKKTFVTDGHLCMWDESSDQAWIIPILPKPSQRTIKRHWSPGTLCLVPHLTTLDVLMDPVQNLIAIVYSVADEDDYLQSEKMVSIDLRALDGDSIHPKAAGRTLIVSGPGPCDNVNRLKTTFAKLKGCGRHIALQRTLEVDGRDWFSPRTAQWQLQIWDWQNSMASNSVLSDTIPHLMSDDPNEFCFLGNDRLLVVTDSLKLYSIEDMSQTPQFLACFQLPIPLKRVHCHPPMDDIEHSSSQLQMQTQQTMYTSDPTHRLLCFTSAYRTMVFVISTRIFFNLDGFAAATPIPWNLWGPSNTRVFQYPFLCKVHISGHRVLQAFTTPDRHAEYEVHMMDFSPLAVSNRQGLGRVVKEPSTIEETIYTTKTENVEITSSLPYVEVVSDSKFYVPHLQRIWLDKDRVYLLSVKWDSPQSSRLDVIDI